MNIFTKAGAIDTLERAARTFAQVFVTLLASVQGGLLHVAWTGSLSVAGLAALVSVLNYVVASPTKGTATVSTVAVPVTQPVAPAAPSNVTPSV